MTTAPYIPAISTAVALAGWDTFDNQWHALNLDYIRQPQVFAEAAHILDVLDTRDAVTATIPITSAIGVTATGTITVPTGEVWFINAIEIISPTDTAAAGDILQVNFAVDVWPLAAVATGKTFFAAFQGTAALNNYFAEFCSGATFLAVTNKPTPLRLEAGDVITLHAVLTGAIAAAALVATLIPYGYKGKKIITR